jgi:hypothetical protein
MPLSEEILATAATNVGDDVTSFFSRYLRPAGPHGGFAIELNGVEIDPRELVVSSNSVVGIPWAFRGIHINDFLGVCKSGILVELLGATFVDMSSGKEPDWTYSRYIDYLGALHQLGVTAVSRPAFTPGDFEEVVKYMRSNSD